MNRTTTFACAALTALSLLPGCKTVQSLQQKSAAESKSDAAHPAPAAQPDSMQIKLTDALRAEIEVGSPAWTAVSNSLSVAGRVEADETRLARVGTPVTGRIAELNAVEGQSVTRGQVLATLNSVELSEGQLSFLKALSQVQLAQRATARAKLLLDAGVIGAAELQRREADYAQASAELTTLHDRLRVLGMSEDAVTHLEQTRAVNSLTRVVASIDGAILERKVTPGQVVQPADTLFVIGDLSQVWLVADVPEQSAGAIKPGKSIEAEVPALPGRTVRGRLSFVSSTVQPETHTVRVRMDLPNPGLLFKPAMLANIRLQDQPERQLVIPAAAVVREGDLDCVFVETGPATFELKPITLGAEFQDKRVVASGLQPTQRIVVNGGFHLNSERKRASLHGE